MNLALVKGLVPLVPIFTVKVLGSYRDHSRLVDPPTHQVPGFTYTGYSSSGPSIRVKEDLWLQ